MNMNPERDPVAWEMLVQFWAATKIMIIAGIVAFLRIAYDGKEEKWQRITLEVLLCSVLAQGFHELFGMFGFNLPVFVSTAVGVIGVYPIRQLMKKKFIEKVEKL
jgi:lambda family phage holin